MFYADELDAFTCSLSALEVKGPGEFLALNIVMEEMKWAAVCMGTLIYKLSLCLKEGWLIC